MDKKEKAIKTVKEKKPRKPRSFHGPLEKAVFDLEIPGETVVALHNAIAFTMAHHDEYIKEGQNCQHCFEAMYVMKKKLSHLIENVGVYQIYRNKLVN